MIETERLLAGAEFLRAELTARERLFVVALVLGFRQVDVARAWGTSAASVSQMARRIREKAEMFWS